MAGDVRLIRSPISVVGMVLATVGGVLFLVSVLLHLFGFQSNPYLGALLFIGLPALFVLGLILIPFGVWRERRRRAAGKPPSSVQWPRIDLNDPHQRTVATIVLALTLANIVIVSLAAYGAVEYMDSVAFCGEVCHKPMKPEFRAQALGSHASATCVSCHIGPSARSFVRTKIDGSRRVVAVMLGSYSQPIIAAPRYLIPSRDTCEHCHSPRKVRGDIVRRMTEYADDEANTASVTSIRLHVGGGEGQLVQSHGIHWHANPDHKVEYIASDDRRQTIPYVKVTDGTGATREYIVDGTPADLLATGERRVMECMDCHNRVGHPISATPEKAVHMAITAGAIPTSLPFVRREAVKVLKVSHASEETATTEIARALREFYQTQPAAPGAGAPQVDQAVRAVQELYRRNVFPDMNVTFGTYPNNIGHIDSPGCFRCHDDEHKSKEGKAIGQDCETCHAIE